MFSDYYNWLRRTNFNGWIFKFKIVLIKLLGWLIACDARASITTTIMTRQAQVGTSTSSNAACNGYAVIRNLLHYYWKQLPKCTCTHARHTPFPHESPLVCHFCMFYTFCLLLKTFNVGITISQGKVKKLEDQSLKLVPHDKLTLYFLMCVFGLLHTLFYSRVDQCVGDCVFAYVS